jgi:uncharacterized SAM-binding protein YcdF (DUF218 family)
MNTTPPGQPMPRNRLAIAITTLSLGVLLGTAWQLEGSLSAQRIIVNLIMPVGLAWMFSLFVACRWLFVKENRRAGFFAAFVFLAIGLLFSPIVNRELMMRVEAPLPAVSPLDPAAPVLRAAVVLGGGTSLGRDGEPQFNTDGQRVAMAAQLWHAGKVSAIICTGEDNYLPESAADGGIEIDRWNPARQAADLLKAFDVPAEKIYRIRGIHTRAEIGELTKFLKEPPVTFPREGEIGLITSAFHIPRAMRLAEAAGLSLVPIPVSYRTAPDEPLNIGDLVPNVRSGDSFYTAVREYLAVLVGR